MAWASRLLQGTDAAWHRNSTSNKFCGKASASNGLSGVHKTHKARNVTTGTTTKPQSPPKKLITVTILKAMLLNPSLPRVINFQIPLQPHHKYNILELGFSYLTQMKDDCTTNSHHLTHTFLFTFGRTYVLKGVTGMILYYIIIITTPFC